MAPLTLRLALVLTPALVAAFHAVIKPTMITKMPAYFAQDGKVAPVPRMAKVAQPSLVSGPQMILTGPTGFLACWAVAAASCALAFVRQAYVFSLSYGLAMAAIGGIALAIPSSSMLLSAHAALVCLYGLRLFAFLFWRQFGQDSGWGRRVAALDKTPRLERVPVILSTSLFYALLASPLLFHVQSGGFLSAPSSAIASAGCVVAAVGLVLEAVADQQKSLFKIALRTAGAADRPFTGGVYAFSRHANYLGEIVFWVGVTMVGLPALLAPGVRWYARIARAISMVLGLIGIVFIMTSATKRLEGKQATNAATVWPVLGKDGELDSYKKYVERSGALVPRFG